MIADRLSSSRGNVFTVLLGGMMLAGALSAMMYQTLSGPLSSMTRVTRSTAASMQSANLAKALLVSAGNQAGADCDADGALEPPEWESEALEGPVNGGKIPYALAASVVDPWGQRYGYCVWDVGPTIAGVGGANNPGCMAGGGARLSGAPTPLTVPSGLQTVMALVSSGPDRVFQTTCKSYTTASGDGSNNLIAVTPGADDIVTRYTYQEAAFAAGDLWSLSETNPQTAAIDKPLTVTASDTTAPAIKALAVVADQNVTATGGLMLGDQNRITACNPGNTGLLRYNTGSGSSVTVSGTTPLRRVKAGTGTSQAASFSALPAAHDTIIVAISGRGTGGAFTVTSVTDNQGNSYSLVGSAATAGNSHAAIYAAYNIAAPSGTFTVTVQYGGGTARSIAFGALAVSGLEQTADNSDVKGVAAANNSTPLTVTSAGNAPTTQANALAIAVHAYENSTGDVNVAYAPQPGWSQVFVNQNAFEYAGLSVVYKVLSQAQIPSHAWSHHAHGATGEYVMAALATFKGASAATGVASVGYCDGSTWREIGDSMLPQVTNIDSLYDGETDYAGAATCTACYVGLGEYALRSVNGGVANTVAGYRAFPNSITGSNNAAMGYNVGFNATGVTNTTLFGSNPSGSNGTLGSAAPGTVGVGGSSLVLHDSAVGTVGFGYLALNASRSGQNVAIGKEALANTGSAFSSTALGYQSLRQNVGGSVNTAAGYQALLGSLLLGANNVGIGYQTLLANQNSSGNTAVGHQALASLNAGSMPTNNTAVGYAALQLSTNGAQSAAAGYQALMGAAGGSGTSNTAAGSGAGRSFVNGSRNTAAGYQALFSDQVSSDSAAAGYQAMRSNNNGSSNTAAGYQALMNHTTPGGIVAIGYQALLNDVTGNFNTAVGHQALALATVGQNTSIGGTGTLSANTTGSGNVAVGSNAMLSNISGSSAVALGDEAANSASNISSFVAAGAGALGTMTASSGGTSAIGAGAFGFGNNLGPNNTGLGAMICGTGLNVGTGNTYYSAGMATYACNGASENTGSGFARITTGSYNVGGGPKLTTGSYNTGDYGGIGGSYNTGFGDLALNGFGASPTNVNNLTAAGYAALSTVEAGAANNTAIGSYAMQGAGGISTATGSTAFGNQALFSMRTGANNTAVGTGALKGSEQALAAEGANTVIGYLAMPTGANAVGATVIGAATGVSNGINSLHNTFIGYSASTILVNGINTTSIGPGAIVTGDNRILFGDAGTSVYSYGDYVSTSDRRMKKDIVPADLGLDFILKLRPVSYHLRSGDDRLYYGFVAQEVQEALGERQTNIAAEGEDADKTWTMAPTQIVAPLVKAVQERQVAIDRQAREIEDLRSDIEAAEKALAALRLKEKKKK